MLNNLAAFFHKYDPMRFSFFYALKALFALIISLYIGKELLNLNNQALIFLSLACMFIFFMNNFQSSGFKRLGFLCIFILLTSSFLFCIKYFVLLKAFVIVPSFIWVFLISLTPLISQDLSKICLFSTLYSFAILLVASEYGLIPSQVFMGLLTGCFCSVLIRVISFEKYGFYTKKHILMILDDLIYTCEYMPTTDFRYWRMSAITHIDEMKHVFEAKGSTIKDANSIKHQEKALFYLYKCEEIAFALISLRIELRKNVKKDKVALKALQHELIYNLKQLKLIFKQKQPLLKNACLLELKKDRHFAKAHETLDVLYQKFELFVKGGERKISLKPYEKFSFKEFKSKLTFENESFKYALKVALAVSIALLIANFLKLDHGIWIAAFIFSIMKIKTTSVRVAGVQNLIGLFVGLSTGLMLIYLFKGSEFFPFILLFSYFCAIYFTFFRPTLASIAITNCLCVYYSVISSNYLNLVIIRLEDILLSFSIAMSVSYLLWPCKSSSALYVMFLDLLQDCKDLLVVNQKDDFHPVKHKLIEDLEDFSKLLNELRDKKSYNKFLNMQVVIENLNLAITNLHNLDTSNPQAKADINILLTRFTMLEAKAKKRAFYFYPPTDLLQNLHCKDVKLRHSLYLIALEQHRAYKIITKASKV